MCISEGRPTKLPTGKSCLSAVNCRGNLYGRTKHWIPREHAFDAWHPTTVRVLADTGSLEPASDGWDSVDPSRRRILGKIVKIERYLVALDGDLEDAIDKVARHRHRLKCRAE